MDGEDAQVAAASKQANKPKATHTHKTNQANRGMYVLYNIGTFSIFNASTHSHEHCPYNMVSSAFKCLHVACTTGSFFRAKTPFIQGPLN